MYKRQTKDIEIFDNNFKFADLYDRCNKGPFRYVRINRETEEDSNVAGSAASSDSCENVVPATSRADRKERMKDKEDLRIYRMVGLNLHPRHRYQDEHPMATKQSRIWIADRWEDENGSEISSPRSPRRGEENRVRQITNRTDKMRDLVHQVESEIDGQPTEFEIGDYVRYYSVSANRWTKATVLKDRGRFADPHGRFQLSCKHCADPAYMRLLAKAAEEREKPNKYGWQPPRRPLLTGSQENAGIVSTTLFSAPSGARSSTETCVYSGAACPESDS